MDGTARMFKTSVSDSIYYVPKCDVADFILYSETHLTKEHSVTKNRALSVDRG